MSRIYFHSPSGEAEIRGSERAWMGNIINGYLYNALDFDPFGSGPPAILRLIPQSSYLHREYQPGPISGFLMMARTWVAASRESFVLPDGTDLDKFEVALSTACDAGSDPVKLMARLHGQCEIHAYVEGPNRAWLAGIIEEGRKLHLLRNNMGWEELIVFLRQRDDEPVVTSYSVCEQFPNAYAALGDDALDDNRRDAWSGLPRDQRWAQAMAGIRSNRYLEMRPDNWNGFAFGGGINGYELQEIANAAAPGVSIKIALSPPHGHTST